MTEKHFEIVAKAHAGKPHWGETLLLVAKDGGFGAKGRILLKCGSSNKELPVASWTDTAVETRLPDEAWCSGPYHVAAVRANARGIWTAVADS